MTKAVGALDPQNPSDRCDDDDDDDPWGRRGHFRVAKRGEGSGMGRWEDWIPMIQTMCNAMMMMIMIIIMIMIMIMMMHCRLQQHRGQEGHYHHQARRYLREPAHPGLPHRRYGDTAGWWYGCRGAVYYRRPVGDMVRGDIPETPSKVYAGDFYVKVTGPIYQRIKVPGRADATRLIGSREQVAAVYPPV
jgi:hypothetical protein